MSGGSLIFIPSENQLVSGIPEKVEIISTDPATIIYYTTDGSVPSPLSHTYTDPVVAPTDGSPFVLSAVPYDLVGTVFVPGALLSFTWSQETSAWTDRKKKSGGINYSYPGGISVPLLYGADGYIIYSIDVEPQDVQYLYSDRDKFGNTLDLGFYQGIEPPDGTPQINDDTLIYTLSTLGNEDFNPKSPIIIIDTRQESMSRPAVPVVNGPYMTLRDPDRYWRGTDYSSIDETNYTSGSHIKSFYNSENKTYAAYYFDSADTKWIKSISNVTVRTQTGPAPRFRIPLVFQWMMFGSQHGF